MVPIGRPETSVTDFHPTLPNVPAERGVPDLQRGGCLESRLFSHILIIRLAAMKNAIKKDTVAGLSSAAV